MTSDELRRRARLHIDTLCVHIPDRSVGSPGNQRATDYITQILLGLGWEVRRTPFPCMDWMDKGATLSVEEDYLPVFASPYGMPASLTAPLVAASSQPELAKLDATGKILLLHGQITRAQLFPRNFPFLAVPEHQEIYTLLERANPAAILAATGSNPEVAGGASPFPLIEDGDFDIPSTYLTDVLGERLLQLERTRPELRATLHIDCERIPASACNVLARRTPFTTGHPPSQTPGKHIAFTAHIDSKKGTPGAIDNASGVTTLLLLAELLSGRKDRPPVELLFLNGEDYYNAPGQAHYVATERNTFSRMALLVNVDGAGFKEHPAAYSLYGCGGETEEAVQTAFASHTACVPGPQWYQGDHAVFVQMGLPALAVTSDGAMAELSSRITHTPADEPSIVNLNTLADLAGAFCHLVDSLLPR